MGLLKQHNEEFSKISRRTIVDNSQNYLLKKKKWEEREKKKRSSTKLYNMDMEWDGGVAWKKSGIVGTQANLFQIVITSHSAHLLPGEKNADENVFVSLLCLCVCVFFFSL